MRLHQPEVFKVLHQSHSIAQYHPKTTLDILWPCARFAISLQARADQDLNLFESTLLQLLGEGERDLVELSQKMGLMNENSEHSSLIEFLILKLEQLNLISDRLRLTDEGKQVLEKLSNETTQVISATVYFDLINNYWLPVISRGELKLIHTEYTNNSFVEFSQGSVGRVKKIRALPVLSETNFAKAPSERDVIDIIKRSRQQNKKLSAFSGISNNDGFVTSKGTISVSPESELVYLHCYAFKVVGVRPTYISDGFRPAIQERFTREFNNPYKRQRNLSIGLIYEQLYRNSLKNYQLQGMRKTESLEMLYKNLINAKVANSIEQSEYENDLSSFVNKSYYEIERMLAACFDFSKLNQCTLELATDPKENAKLAEKIADKLGFNLEKNKLMNQLLMVRKGSVIHLKAESPSMLPLLLCHLLIAQGGRQQPMLKLAEKYPALLSDIALLRHWRNSIDHSNVESIRSELGLEQIEFVYNLVEKMREILSSWLESKHDRVSVLNDPNWLKDDIRSQAFYKLDKEFGELLSRMSESVYQGLFDALILTNLEDARRRTNALSGALQHTLYHACQALDPNEAEDLECIRRKLLNHGAKQIINSNPHKIQQTLNGINTTVGANFVAFYAQITDQQQNEISRFIRDVDELDKIRGHSGPILGKQDSLNKIEKKIFQLIKLLMEQYCG